MQRRQGFLHAAGQGQSCNRVHDAAAKLPLPPSQTQKQELVPAYYSSTPSRNPSQASNLAHPQHNATPLQPTAISIFASQSSASALRQQDAPASASSLIATPVCRTTSQLGPAAALHKNQLHTAASKYVPLVKPHQSVSAPQPESAARQLGPDISFLNAVQQRHWDHAGNARLGHILVKPQSSRKAHWICTQCPDGLPHRWKASIAHIYRSSKANNSGCPYCSGNAVCRHSSLARKAPYLIQEWDATDNLDTPGDYTFGSNHSAHWVCAHGHRWQASIKNRVKDNKGCPGCARARRGQKAPTLTASSGRIMQIWDHVENAKAGLDPSRLTCGSRIVAHFKCLLGHQWLAQIDRVARISTRGCPHCHKLQTRAKNPSAGG